MRSESNAFAFSNSFRRCLLRPFPPRLMKYNSIRRPEVGPFGETSGEASVFAMVAASFVNRPSGGNVDTVFTLATQFRRPRPPDLRFFALRSRDFCFPAGIQKPKSLL